MVLTVGTAGGGAAERLGRLLRPDNVVLVETDADRDMARLSVNGTPVMEGNSRDFHPGCHGGWHLDLAAAHGGFRSPQQMAASVAAAVGSLGGRCSVEEAAYAWDAEGGR